MLVKKLMCLAVAGVLAGLVSQASASLITPGTAILAASGAGPTGGTMLGTTGAVVISTPTYTGTMTSTVIKDDPSNPFGAGHLTFTYLIHDNTGSLNSIERMTVSSFTGFSTDVSYQTPGSGQLPTSMDRSAAGDVVGFSFTPTPLGAGSISPGASSALLVIQTNATGFSPTFASMIDGSVASVASFAPAAGAGAPEPASLSIAALSGAGLLLRRRRRPV